MEWLKKKCYSSTRGGDVVITKTTNKKNKTDLLIHFHRGSFLKISKTQYIKIAIQNHRMYFAEATKNEGWKLSCYREDNRTATLRISGSVFEGYNIPAGVFYFEFDEVNGLYNVDLNCPFEEE